MSNDALKALHDALVDARNGYREAVKDTDDATTKALFNDMIALHERSHGELHPILVSHGETTTDDGSFMTTVHETVIAVRAAVTGLGSGSLSSFASGEERNVSAYDKAIEEQAGDATAVQALTRQKAALEAKIAQMKTLST